MSDSSCDYLRRGQTLGEGLQEEARSHMKKPHIHLGIWGPATGLACHPLPSPPGMPTFPHGLAASAIPGWDCIILGFVCRAAGGGGGPAAPRFSLIFHSLLAILLLPPFSGHNTPGIVCLTPRFSAPFPPSPTPQGAPESPEAKARRLGAGSAPG